MSQADFERDAIDWDQTPPEPVVHWQAREPRFEPADAAVGGITLLVFTLAGVALGMLLAERLRDRRLA